jgi:dihydrodipicolinate synthase/N-acetylneuraminate lyase
MDIAPQTYERIRKSVIAVPPLARTITGELDWDQNSRIIRYLEGGGVNILLYGGNALLYHVRPSEYRSLLEYLTGAVKDTTAVVPSVGPTYGMMMDQAAVLRDFEFPTAMVLPQRDITDPQGIVRGIRTFVDAYEKPVVLYLKFARWLPTQAVVTLVREGLVSWIKYAVVRDDPAVDDELSELVEFVSPQQIISGIGEQPAIVHMKQFGVAGFTSGCVCVAPRRSMQMLNAIYAGDIAEADAIRGKFSLLEDLRNAIHPIRVLHHAVEQAGIANTGPILPLLSEVSPEQLELIRNAASSLFAWDQAVS